MERYLRKVLREVLYYSEFTFIILEFSAEDLLEALSPVLDMLYDQFPDCLPFRQPVDPVVLQIPVSI